MVDANFSRYWFTDYNAVSTLGASGMRMKQILSGKELNDLHAELIDVLLYLEKHVLSDISFAFGKLARYCSDRNLSI